MSEESEHLRQFARDRSPEAFRALVERYIGVVYAAARRQVGDADLAHHDVTQAVFLVLTEKATALDSDRPLSGWLLKVTRYASANAVRLRARRARHEQEAAQMKTTIADPTKTDNEWQELAPLLDEGMSRLRAGDRDVLLLRYFERKTAREMGLALGISEGAAEKRLARAVERLRDFFRRRGVAVSAPGISAGLLVHASEATPKALSAGISAAASSSASSIAKGVVVTMATAKAKLAAIAAVLALLLVGGSVAVAVKMLGSPAAHQVDVRQTLAAEQAIDTAKTYPGSVTFSDGTRVDLIGITATPGQATGWWAADGTPISAPQPLPRSVGSISAFGSTVYQMILRQRPTGSKDADISVSVTQSGAMGFSSATSSQGRVLNLQFAIPSEQSTTDMTLSCATGPWKEDWRYELKNAQTAPATQPAGMTIGKMYEEHGETKIEIRDDRQMRGRDKQLDVITSNGKQVSCTSSTSSIFSPTVYGFRVPVAQVVALISLSRALEFGKIENISLQPRAKTPATAPAP